VAGPRPSSLRAAAAIVAAAPVAGDVPERREPRLAPIGPDAQAVDPRAADDGHAPAAVGPGAQQRQRVVADDDVPRPPALLDALARGDDLAREVDPGQQEVGARDRRVRAAVERLDEQRLDAVERALEAVLVRRAARPARERDQLALGRDEREVGLGVAAVDGEQQLGHRAATASRSSSSPSTISTWPTSG
jgi:hypothetical protein